MDWNSALRWFGLLACGATLVRGLAVWRMGDKLWALAATLIVGVGTALYFFAPSVDGIVSTSVWALLVLAPGLVGRMLAAAAGREQHARALALARLYYVLHPS